MTNFYSNPNTPKTVYDKIDENMVKNSDGAFVYEVSDEMKLKRFLILGCENGTFYATGKKLLEDSYNVIDRMIACGKSDYIINEILDISTNGKSRKNDQLIASLIKVFVKGDDIVKTKITEIFTKIVRTGTHFFLAHQIMKNYIDAGEIGWGNKVKNLFKTYFDQETEKLAFQMLKYRNRENWTWKDSLRLNHIKPVGEKDLLYKYFVKEITPEIYPEALRKIEGFEKAKVCTSVKEMLKLITDYKLPEEMIPTELRKDVKIQEALLETMGMTAILRHLASFTSSGFLTQKNSEAIGKLEKMFTDRETLKKAKIHPLALLDALKIYGSGHGFKGSLSWNPVQKIVDILDDAFYMSFDFVEPTNKKILFGIDVSGSMDSNRASNVLSAREATAALVMSFIRNEPNYLTMAFSEEFIDLQLTPKMRIEEVIQKTSRLPFNNTNISVPFSWALQNEIDVDCFMILTDNETNSGQHPKTAMEQYCRKINKPHTKLIVNAVSVNDFSVADPKNKNTMDLVGYSPDIQTIASEFILGNL